jgi:hypothetical protein
VLLSPAQDLHGRPDHRSGSNIGVPDNAVWPYPHKLSDSGLRMRKETAKANLALARAATQCHSVIGYAHVASYYAGDECAGLRKEAEYRFNPAKSRRRRARE